MQASAQHAFNADMPEARETEKAKEVAKQPAKEPVKGAADWKLVLQLGVDEAVGLRGGAYYVLMRREDILARRFSNTWVEYQFD